MTLFAPGILASPGPLMTAAFPPPAGLGAVLTATREESRGLIAERVPSHEPRFQQGWFDGPLIRLPVKVVPEFVSLALVGEDNLLKESDPPGTTIIPPETVFRHYVSREETLRLIQETGCLRGGDCPYFIRGGGHPYLKLKGIFATSPKTSAEAAGRDWSVGWIDFRFWPGTGMLDLTRGGFDCFLIPLSADRVPIQIVNAGLLAR